MKRYISLLFLILFLPSSLAFGGLSGDVVINREIPFIVDPSLNYDLENLSVNISYISLLVNTTGNVTYYINTTYNITNNITNNITVYINETYNDTELINNLSEKLYGTGFINGIAYFNDSKELTSSEHFVYILDGDDTTVTMFDDEGSVIQQSADSDDGTFIDMRSNYSLLYPFFRIRNYNNNSQFVMFSDSLNYALFESYHAFLFNNNVYAPNINNMNTNIIIINNTVNSNTANIISVNNTANSKMGTDESGTSGRVTFFTNSQNTSSNQYLYWNNASSSLNVGNPSATIPQLVINGGSGGGYVMLWNRTSGANLAYAVSLAGNKLTFTNYGTGASPLQLSTSLTFGSTSEINIGFDQPTSSAVSTPGENGLIKGANGASGASATSDNVNGGNLSIASGRGTGNVAGSSLRFYTPASPNTAKTLQVLTERMRISDNNTISFNMVNISTYGQPIVLNGSATVFNDIVAPLQFAHVGASAPTWDENNMSYYFQPTAANDYIFVEFQIPHWYKEGSSLECHIHGYPATAVVGNVNISLSYTWTNYGNVQSNPTYISKVFTTSGTAYQHNIIDLTTISGTGKTISSVFKAKLKREATSAPDTYNGNYYIDFFDCHAEQDTLGSNTNVSKW